LYRYRSERISNNNINEVSVHHSPFSTLSLLNTENLHGIRAVLRTGSVNSAKQKKWSKRPKRAEKTHQAAAKKGVIESNIG
jgi:hypothetical protein